jgi:mannose-6-phosphate isomerase-like protein (cupin superfamily)
MDTFMVRFIEDSDSLNLFSQCNGQVFAYLQSGELQFDIDNKSYVVQKGDTLYFNAKRNFRIQNIYKGTSELICVSMNIHQ